MTSDDPKKAAKDIADRAAQGSEDTKSTIKDAASKTGETMRDYAARTSDAANDLYGKTQDRLRDAADALPDSASDAMAAGRRAYDRSSETIGRRVAKQPIEALLLAGAIGYLVGWATNRS